MAPRIAVITPYYREPPAMLRNCHQSVLEQQVGARHYMIADGFPLPEIDDWNLHHVKLPTAHSDNGNTPRGLGSLLAKAEGHDFIAWLDADNWFLPGHLASLLAVHEQTGAPICSTLRHFHAWSGEPLDITEADENALQHIDTSCFLIHRSRFDVLGIWLDMPAIVAPLCDRVFVATILRQGHHIRSTGQRTVAFRSQYAAHYRAAGLPVPPGAKEPDFANAAWAYLRNRPA